MKVAVIGGGISGLAATYRLQRAGFDALCLEGAHRAGGKIESERADGFLVEHGPNGFLSSRTAVTRLARDVGLGDRILAADESAKYRYLVGSEGLQRLPTSPPNFLLNPVLSLPGRIRILRERFIKGRVGGGDESIYDFAVRRFGIEAAERLFDPMVTGIHAGDIRRLSLSACFPAIADLEAQHGSVIKGLIARQKAAKASGPTSKALLTSFQGGMADLVDGCVGALGARRVQFGRVVSRLERVGGHQWRVHASGGDPLLVDHVIMTTPADVSARLMSEHNSVVSDWLNGIDYAPAAVVALGYRAERIVHPAKGFGYLAPSSEKRDVLGVLWSSQIFTERAPDGHVLFRAIVGGAHRPELVSLNQAELCSMVAAELSFAFRSDLREPEFSRVVYWPQGIPQYRVGHEYRIKQIRAALGEFKGLHIAGNAIVGVSVAECIGHAETIPELLKTGQ
ncbi:MAG: protoporphyrinogen oxidase [Myxococcota bacterium]|nr:protoporphyrinogen oxidase [Myxococcota bacterium]